MNIYAERLMNVCRAVRESPAPSRFTMTRLRHTCGTPACAIGHYLSRPDLQSLGAFDRGGLIIGGMTRFETWMQGPTPVADHFGITDKEYIELFSMEGCGNAQTPAEAISYIEAFIARKWPVVVGTINLEMEGETNESVRTATA